MNKYENNGDSYWYKCQVKISQIKIYIIISNAEISEIKTAEIID